jgi:hypothetical protein
MLFNVKLKLNLTMGKNQHIVPNDNKWGVKGEGNEKLTKVFDTQKASILYAKMLAEKQKSEVVIHSKEGKIRDKDSYGNDPNPPKDKKH